jgi:hypothetical protein
LPGHIDGAAGCLWRVVCKQLCSIHCCKLLLPVFSFLQPRFHYVAHLRIMSGAAKLCRPDVWQAGLHTSSHLPRVHLLCCQPSFHKGCCCGSMVVPAATKCTSESVDR